ncbi:MAG: hypothetical protein ACRDCI_00125 [Plesiomonas shigelloides]
MPNIDQINISGELTGEDRFLIYDRDTGAARTVTADTALSYYLEEIVNSGQIKTVTNIEYENQYVILTFSDGSTKQAGPITGGSGNGQILINGNQSTSIIAGSGIAAGYDQSTKQTTLSTISTASIGNHFVGIYQDLPSLQDAVKHPDNNYQAIVISPSEKYFHSIGGQWMELAPVGAIHPTYIGAYDTVHDLQAASPSAADQSVAIIGTQARAFYIKLQGVWNAITGSDLPSLTARVQVVESGLSSTTAIAHGNTAAIQQLDQDIKADMQVMQSDIAQKISGLHVEDIGNHAFDDINALHFIGATVSDDGSQQATITIDKQKINVSNGQEPSSKNFDVENLEFPGANLSTRDNGRIAVVALANTATGIDVTVDGASYAGQKSVEFEQFTSAKNGDKLVLTPQSTSGANLVIDDGTSSIGGITKIEVPTSKLVDKSAGVVELTPRVEFQNLSGGSDSISAHSVTVSAPLKVEGSRNNPAGQPDPDRVTLTIDPAAYERQHTASYLAYLADETNIVGKKGITKHAGALWFDDIVYSSPTYIQIDRNRKLIGIQEYDGLDPNVTGGQDYLIAFRANMKGVAPEDGVVKVYLNEYDELGRDSGILVNSNGQPMAAERSYKAGEKLGALDVVGVVKATALRYFSCNVEDTFNDAYLTLTDQTEGVTGLMVQSITVGEKTGPALLQFEADTNQDISFSSHYLGPERVDFAWLVRSNEAPVNIAGGIGLTMADGYGFYNLTPVKFGSVNDHLQISDNGSDIADFNLHRIFNAEETQMMRGRDVDVTVTLTNKDMGFRIALLKWDGKPDMYTKEIYKTRTNDNIDLQAGWTIAGELFISEDAIQDDHIATKRFTVPVDANNYAIMIYPTNAQQPLTLLLKDLRLDVTDPFTGYVIHFSEMDRERALEFSEQHMTLYQDNQGYRALRYTINGNDQPMPIGMLGKGLADVSIDNTLNTISGSMAKGGEGGLEFKADGKVTITTALRLWNEKSVGAAVMFWYELVEVGQQRGAMIDASKGTFAVHVGAQAALFYMPTFSIGVTAGQRLILRVTGDGPDCAFLQSVSPSAPMLYTTVTFDEFTAGAYDDPFAGIDMSSFTNVRYGFATADIDFFNKSSINVQVDIPDDVDLVVLSAIKENQDLSVESVARLGWKYFNTTKTLSISFGETVPVGRVILGISA